MSPPIPIGIDDFRALREQGLVYVDKSDLIRELLDTPGVQVVLLPRPRRFGKSLNLSMLRAWFEKRDEDLSHLFRDLSIWQAGEPYRRHFQRYPVIHFDFKGTRAETLEGCLTAIREKIIDLYREHAYLLEGGPMDEVDRRRGRPLGPARLRRLPQRRGAAGRAGRAGDPPPALDPEPGGPPGVRHHVPALDEGAAPRARR